MHEEKEAAKKDLNGKQPKLVESNSCTYYSVRTYERQEIKEQK